MILNIRLLEPRLWEHGHSFQVVSIPASLRIRAVSFSAEFKTVGETLAML
jgi:hypothetical protein